MFLRLGLCRRYVSYVGMFTMILYISANAYYYYIDNYTNSHSALYASRYNEYIDHEGNYLAYSGYKILQFVKKPISRNFKDLNYYLRQLKELQLYFKFVPETTYHITLTNLINQTFYNDSQLELLTQEQQLLDIDDIRTTCTTRKLSLIANKEIRLDVEIKRKEQIKESQNRWDDTLSYLIIEHYASFYITLAYQYKNIPSQQIFNNFDDALRRWRYPFDIILDPIRICAYDDLITYTPIVTDTIVQSV